MTPQRLEKLSARFGNQTILVVGDVMLDHFLWGRVSRISPEAPVPVVEVTRESQFPGGAANVARNLRALGAPVQLLSIVGSDTAGQSLQGLLAEQQIGCNGLIIDSNRPTTLKTRIIAHHQQVVRYDREYSAPISAAIEHQLLQAYRQLLPGVVAVIFEDYAKGLFSQRLLDTMSRLARRAGKLTTADPNSRHPLRFVGLTAVTPNRAEAFAAAGRPSSEPAAEVLKDVALQQVGVILLRKWRCLNLLITLGEQGMCLFRANTKPHHIPTVAQEVYDVSGAGDTAIASLTLALAAQATAVEAAEIANHAAGVVVGKVGTATCSIAELRASCRRAPKPR